MKRADYLNDRTVGNPTIGAFIAKAHNQWLAGFLAENPTAKDRWRPVKMVPGDAAYLETFANNPDRVRKNGDGAWEINILLPFANLAPTGVKMNSSAAVDDFSIVADAILANRLNTSGDITESILEELSDKVHDGWRARESWRSGDPDYDALNIPYSDLPDSEKEKDRVRVRGMYEAICKDCPAE